MTEKPWPLWKRVGAYFLVKIIVVRGARYADAKKLP